MVDDAIQKHIGILGKVEQMNDPSLLELYDAVLGSLSGPRTCRLRSAPTLMSALRMKRAQQAFSRAVHHLGRLKIING